MKVLKKGNTEIGAFEFPDRRKPILGIQIGCEVICYGNFYSKESADDFTDALAEFVGAEPEVRHGRWIKIEPNVLQSRWKCIECDGIVHAVTNFCPFCGTRMDGGENEYVLDK